MWVISARGYAALIDPVTNAVTAYFGLTRDAPEAIVADNRGAWVAEGQLGIARLSIASKAVQVRRILVHGQLADVGDVILSQGSVWASGTVLGSVGSSHAGFVARLDPSTGRVIAVRYLSEPFQLMASTSSAVWATSGRGHLYRVTPSGSDAIAILTNRALRIPDGVTSFAALGSQLWFIAGGGGPLMGLDLQTQAMVRVTS